MASMEQMRHDIAYYLDRIQDKILIRRIWLLLIRAYKNAE